jgi:endo-1,4-beta-xylanase
MLVLVLMLVAAPVGAWAQPARPTPQWLDSNREAPAGTRYVSFHSRTLDAPVSYLVYLPPGSEEDGRRYPVIYWLHGLGGTQRTGAEFFVPHLDAAIRQKNLPPVIVILVNGMVSSFYCDTADGHAVESVIVKDLIPHVDQTYRTIARREARIVQGYSMGGFGAAHLAFKYPELFGAVAVDAGALLTAEALESRHPDLFKARFGGDKQAFEAQHPFTLLQKNAQRVRESLLVHVGVGSLDALLPRNEALHELLDELRIEHTYEIVPDVAHRNRDYYRALGPKAFEFHHRVLARLEQ